MDQQNNNNNIQTEALYYLKLIKNVKNDIKYKETYN